MGLENLKKSLLALITSCRSKWSQFLCSYLGHNGPIIGYWRPVLADKQNKPMRRFRDSFFKRRCQRFGCQEYYSNLEDRIAA
jgi:hypothetical protein